MSEELSFEQIKIKDNPNKNAKIGFVLWYPFQFYVYKDVYKHLSDQAEFIVDLGAFFPVKQPENLIKSIHHILKENNVFYRFLNYDDYFSDEGLSSFFSRYVALVSLWKRGCMNLPFLEDVKKIHLTYGSGKDLTTFGVWKMFFDIILSYGKRDNEIFSQYTKSVIVGNPKFDDWFRNNVDEISTDRLKKRIDPLKKTILYLPTHSDLCSIDYLSESLKEITNSYNLIVKLHYYTSHEENERKKKMQDKRIILFEDDTDLLPLLKVSDIVLSDNSSAIFDAILADKPVVVTDMLDKEYLDQVHKQNKKFRRGDAGAITYSGSIEQKIKQEKLVVVMRQVSDLKKSIEVALADDDFYRINREKIRKKLFSFNDGKCGERAATAIGKFLKLKNYPDRPLLYHLVKKGDKKNKGNASREEMLETIRKTPPVAESFHRISVRLSYDCYVSGKVIFRDGEKIVQLEILRINPCLQNSAVRRVLLEYLCDEAVNLGAKRISIVVRQPATLLACVDIFQESELQFYDVDSGEKLDTTVRDLMEKDKFLVLLSACLKSGKMSRNPILKSFIKRQV